MKITIAKVVKGKEYGASTSSQAAQTTREIKKIGEVEGSPVHCYGITLPPEEGGYKVMLAFGKQSFEKRHDLCEFCDIYLKNIFDVRDLAQHRGSGDWKLVGNSIMLSNFRKNCDMQVNLEMQFQSFSTCTVSQSTSTFYTIVQLLLLKDYTIQSVMQGGRGVYCREHHHSLSQDLINCDMQDLEMQRTQADLTGRGKRRKGVRDVMPIWALTLRQFALGLQRLRHGGSMIFRFGWREFVPAGLLSSISGGEGLAGRRQKTLSEFMVAARQEFVRYHSPGSKGDARGGEKEREKGDEQKDPVINDSWYQDGAFVLFMFLANCFETVDNFKSE